MRGCYSALRIVTGDKLIFSVVYRNKRKIGRGNVHYFVLKQKRNRAWVIYRIVY